MSASVQPPTLEDIKTLAVKVVESINSLTEDNTNDELLVSLKGTLTELENSIPKPQGGRRRSAKKRGTQRKQKRRQRRGSRRAY